MKWNVACAVASALLLSGAGCEILDDGGGGGGGISDFVRGFVFVRSDDGDVYAADDRDLQTVAGLTANGDNRHPSLSPDGRTVVYVHAGTSLQRVAMAGGDPATLYTATAAQGRLANPVYSPDGSRIAFTFESGGISHVAVVNADGTGFSQASQAAPLSYLSPTFFPDGDHVLVAAGNATSGFTQLEKLNLDTGFAQNLGSVGVGLAVENRVALSPDGTRAAFDAASGTGSRIFVLDLFSGTGDARQLTEYPAGPTVLDTFPSWAGTSQVAYSSDDGGNDNVYRISASASLQTGALVLPSAIQPWYGP